MTEDELEQMHSWIVWEGKAHCTDCGMIKTDANKFKVCGARMKPKKLSVGQILAELSYAARVGRW
jgi:hypothetical protein